MLKEKNRIEDKKMSYVKKANIDDTLKYNIQYRIEFSDMDTNSKDKLISELCKRLIKLERKKGVKKIV